MMHRACRIHLPEAPSLELAAVRTFLLIDLPDLPVDLERRDVVLERIGAADIDRVPPEEPDRW